MVPHRGHRLNNALIDSKGLVEAMVKVQNEQRLDEMVAMYDRKIFERGKLEMDISLKQTMGIHSWETIMQIPNVKMGMRQAKAEAENQVLGKNGCIKNGKNNCNNLNAYNANASTMHPPYLRLMHQIPTAHLSTKRRFQHATCSNATSPFFP